jgi:hypothetical protein
MIWTRLSGFAPEKVGAHYASTAILEGWRASYPTPSSPDQLAGTSIQLFLKQLQEDKTAAPRWPEWLPAEEAAHLKRRITALDEQIEELCRERTRLRDEAILRAEEFRHNGKTKQAEFQAKPVESKKVRGAADVPRLRKWLPHPVAIEATWWSLRSTPPGCRPSLHNTAGWQLATHEAMRNVWHFLERPRPGGHCVPCLNDSGEHSPECYEQSPASRCAFRVLFREAIWLRSPLVSHEEAVEEARRDRTRATQLRAYHAELDEQRHFALNGCQVVLANTAFYDSRRQQDWASPFSSDVLRRDKYPLKILLELAAFHEERATWLEARAPAETVHRRGRTNPELYNFIVELTRVTRETFGLPLYGVVATIATVLFEPDQVSPSRVRSIVRRRARCT